MDGTIQAYVLDMAADTKKEPLRVKQYDTNSRQARITLKMGGEPWTIPFGCQIHINVRKTDGKLADATCTREDEHTVLAPITEQMTAVTGTQLGELYFLGSDGDIKSQTFPVVVYEAVMDQARIESSDDFQSLQEALRDVKASTDTADIAAQYATEQGNAAGIAAQRAEDAADSIQAAVDAAANAKACESNAKNSELAAAQTQQEVTDYVEAQKAAFVGYSQRESDSKYANALTKTVTGEGGITVEDAWTAPVRGLEVVGKSEQVQTTGAQLLNISELAIGGLAGNNGAEFETQTRVRTGYISVVGGETYKLSGYKPYAVHSAFAYGADKTVIGSWNIDTSVPQNAAYVRISLKKSDEGNFTVDDLATLKKSLMFNAGSAVLPYEPYTGGAPSPSPDYPQDIISTGTVSTGKQMLDFEQCLKEWNSKYTQSSGRVYTVNALGTGFQNPISFSDEDIKVTLSGKVRDISGSRYRIELLDISENLVGRIDKDTKSITVMASKIRLNFTEGGAGEYADIMLNAGDTALPWEPYTGGKPSPSVEYPQTLEVRTTGANLANITSKNNTGISVISENGEIKINGTVAEDHSSADIYVVGVYESKIVRLAGINTYQIFGLTNDEELYVINVSSVVRGEKGETPITYNGDVTCIIVRLKAGKTYNNMVIRPMVSAGNTALPWEPYRSASATITLTEPLCDRDRIMCRDGVWGIERWVIEEAIYIRSIIKLSNGKTGGICNKPGSDNIKGVFCSNASKTISNSQMSCGQFYENPANIVLIGDEDDTIETLREKYKEGYFAFVTDIPTWEPLPDATQQALNALTTYAGTTHLTITAGGPVPTVTLDYVQDTHKALEQCQGAAKEYTDNQLAAIVAALPTATQAAIVDNQTTRLLQEV